MSDRLTFLSGVISSLPLLAMASGVFALDIDQKNIDLVLKTKATVASHRVYLSDVATCSGAMTYCQEISGIDVAQSPSAGRTGFLQKSHIEAIVGKEWPGVKTIISGPDAIRIETVAVELSAEDLRQKFEDLLLSKFHTHKNLRLRVSRLQPMSQVKVRPTQVKVDFPDVRSMGLDDRVWVLRNMIGNRPIQVKVFSSNDPDDASIIQANAYITLEAQLPLPVQTIGVGQTIAADAVAMGWITMRRGYQDAAFDLGAIVGRKTRQTLQAGEPISPRFLENATAVMRNQSVKMLVKSGELEISARGITQQAGSVGQTIDVVNAATKRKLKARIVDEQTVEAVSF
ncbi:MAG: flagellar basal body P-ring formation chaperone FlgA [bacterium]